jgi:hypothetical protein
LIAARKGSPALTSGSLDLVDLPGGAGVVGWDRTSGDDRRRVLISMSDDEVALPADWTVEVASDGDGTEGGAGGELRVLAPGRAVVLRPA